MVTRIEVRMHPEMNDALGRKTARRICDDLEIPIGDVRIISVYTVDADLNLEVLQKAAEKPFCDPVIQEAFVGKSAAADLPWDWCIEVGFLPGVTDNVGRTASEALALIAGRPLGPTETVCTSTQFLVSGTLSRQQVERIALDFLCNTLIQRFTITSRDEFNPAIGFKPYVPRVTSDRQPQVRTINLEVEDSELMKISKQGVLALSLEEMKVIRDYFRNPRVQNHRASLGLSATAPTDVELETLAQTWSEHCKHKIFASQVRYEEKGRVEIIDNIFRSYIKAATAKVRENKGVSDYCLSVFTDNAGVIRFDDDYSLVMKVETHNSPSALDPYGGALTGIVGVNRDPFGTGKGCRLIFNTDTFCFASPFWNKELPPRLLHPKRIFEGVREGVEHGGNKSGIPTINGSIVFDDRFLGKPLVFCGTAGLMPATVCGAPGHVKAALPGDVVVMVGGRIGKDGIHGATFSSEMLHEGSPATAVQIGDPITQKRMTDFLLVARDRCLYNSITDNGAGGLASSVGEMARDTDGVIIDLSQAPLKYSGLDPWEILLSEAQERMTLAVPQNNLNDFLSLASKMQVEATTLGNFNSNGFFTIKYSDKVVACLSMKFLHEGTPQMNLEAIWEPPKFPKPIFEPPKDYGHVLKEMLKRLNICSKEYVIRQYDHEVQGGSVIKPLVGATMDGPSDAGVLRPALDRFRAVVTSSGLCPRYSDIDAYAMAAAAIDEAVRNAICVGADPDYLAGLDNFCWCDPVFSDSNPDGKYKMAQLVRANKAVYDTCTAYGVPCISGKDSMKNDFAIGNHKISIPPTLLFTVIGVMDDCRKAITMDVKHPGDFIYILGITRDELGASEYFAKNGFIGNKVPSNDAQANIKLYRKLHCAIQSGLVQSSHDCSDGGLGTAVAEMVFAGGYGAKIDLSYVPYEGISRDDYILFSESCGRILVTIKPEHAKAFESALEDSIFAKIGEVISENKLKIIGNAGNEILAESIDELKAAWQITLDFGRSCK